jgi:hypothetical protein
VPKGYLVNLYFVNIQKGRMTTVLDFCSGVVLIAALVTANRRVFSSARRIRAIPDDEQSTL